MVTESRKPYITYLFAYIIKIHTWTDAGWQPCLSGYMRCRSNILEQLKPGQSGGFCCRRITFQQLLPAAVCTAGERLGKRPVCMH